MVASLPPRLRAAGIGPGPSDEQVAAAQRREQLQPAGRRLHQSDFEAQSRRSREAARRNLIKRRGLPDPKQPVLARRSALLVFEFWHAAAAAARQGHYSLLSRS